MTTLHVKPDGARVAPVPDSIDHVTDLLDAVVGATAATSVIVSLGDAVKAEGVTLIPLQPVNQQWLSRVFRVGYGDDVANDARIAFISPS